MKALRLTLAVASLVAMVWAPASAQEIQERTIKFGHLNNTDHPVSLGVKRFAELVAAKSGGKLKVQEFPSSTLGNEMQQQSALQGGVQEMSAPATTSLQVSSRNLASSTFRFRSAPMRRPTHCSTVRWARP